MLHILHVNDTETSLAAGWPQLATLIRRLRDEGRCDLLLHAGDVPLGDPLGAGRLRILNLLAFDGLALGNHDLDLGVAALHTQMQNSGAALLCANVTGFPDAKPYIITRSGGYRVALCGVTVSEMHLLQPDRNIPGMRFLDPAESLRLLIPDLRRQADIVIVVSHCGLETDRSLAMGVEGIDLIVGGHSHHALKTPERVGRTWITQAGSGASALGWVELSSAGGLLSVSGGLLPTGGLPADPEVLAIACEYSVRLAEDEIVGYTEGDLRCPDYARETPLGNWTADALRTYAEADLALVRCASVPTTIEAGPIRRSELGGLSFIGIDRVARLTLAGAELLEVLELGARDAYYLINTAGARVEYEAHRPVGERVRSATVGGEPVNRKQTYTVACSEVMARGAAGFTPLVGKPYELLPATIVEVLAQQLEREGRIRPQLDGRLVVEGRLPVRPPA